MTSDNPQLDRVRKLLAKAENAGVTPQEAEALTAKAAELMARYGIDRALLAAAQPETDVPGDRVITIPNPWAAVHAHLLCGIGSAMRCQCVLLSTREGARVHVFGYASDIERAEVLYTSLLLQMSHGLARVTVPQWTKSPRALRRSWQLGYATAVIARVRVAERAAAAQADSQPPVDGCQPAALVLASRDQVVSARARQAYPVTRKAKVTYTGSGYRDGYTKGQTADIGTTRITRNSKGALR
jgi:hypothetical protein